jgi:peptidase E
MKVILHGGNANKKSAKNDIFFAEVINSVNKDNVKVLCIYFARPEERWEDSYAEDQSQFFATAVEAGKEVETKMASYDLAELRELIQNTDVIFINGGRRGRLKTTLEELKDFPDLIKDKVVVGISAGANVLCKYYYSSVADAVREGIGLLDINLLTHYMDDETDGTKLKMLKDYKEALPIVKIKEEKFTIPV